MPTIGTLHPNSQLSSAIEQLIRTLESSDRQPPVVNVVASKRPAPWVFTVIRDQDKLISQIVAKPQFPAV